MSQIGISHFMKQIIIFILTAILIGCGISDSGQDLKNQERLDKLHDAESIIKAARNQIDQLVKEHNSENPSDAHDGTIFLSSARDRLDLGLDSLEEIEAAMIKDQQDKK